MKSYVACILGAAIAASSVSAQQAVVVNSCTSNVYVQSFPFDGSAAGTLTTLAPGGRYAEDFHAAGSTIKLATDKALSTPLFFGYSFTETPDYAYYELSSEWGNPFSKSHNILTPGDGCQVFDCDAGAADCYSTPAMKKVYGCPQPVNLEATLCA
ncbi:Uu.00g104560.m01.CDS01 [Anthostomella pinea]|uniref:Uu.00g104560.m01.CDS01 n=1 Tax=Anthostomella pinea TaxID=933095 RepID=A0AAI8VDQ5_9PEZI|nr:Uu.00g104560.m01.CDS01 [Anthostomella pinea]